MKNVNIKMENDPPALTSQGEVGRGKSKCKNYLKFKHTKEIITQLPNYLITKIYFLILNCHFDF
jgi:hypothetical protein